MGILKLCVVDERLVNHMLHCLRMVLQSQMQIFEFVMHDFV